MEWLIYVWSAVWLFMALVEADKESINYGKLAVYLTIAAVIQLFSIAYAITNKKYGDK